MTRLLIADDERLMREQLKSRLQQVWPTAQVVAEAATGSEAIDLAHRVKPDAAFLDIRMPGLSGIEAATQLPPATQVVFVTAYDSYAIGAFEQGALDYLLKPVDNERLAVTVERLKQRSEHAAALPTEALKQLLENWQGQRQRQPLVWLQAASGERLEFIAVNEVLFFQAADKYTRVVRNHGECLIRKPIYELADELDPEQFWRIHRGAIVNIAAIRDISRDLSGLPRIRLKGCTEILSVSRSFAHRFKAL